MLITETIISFYRIQRNCEDFCCRRSNTVKKSIDYNEFNDVNKHSSCDASNVSKEDFFLLLSRPKLC